MEEPLKAVFIDTYRDVNSPAEVQKFNVSSFLITSVTDPDPLKTVDQNKTWDRGTLSRWSSSTTTKTSTAQLRSRTLVFLLFAFTNVDQDPTL